MTRWLLRAALALPALLVLHVAGVMAYDPRDGDAETIAPRTLTLPASVPGEATLLFAGDTGAPEDALPTLAAQGFDYPYRPTADLVRGADVAIANLEAPITDGGVQFPIYMGWNYRQPPAVAPALAAAGIDVVTLANNHILDWGLEGLRDTLTHLDAAGVPSVGAGASGAEARRALIITVGGLRVGLLAYCENQVAFRTYLNLFAVRGHGGAAPLTDGNLRRDLARLRPQVDLVVVALHMGENNQPPRATSIAWAHRAVDLGADLVVGHHPHVAHPAMIYRGRPILLSLGNYAWGTSGWPRLDYGFLALAHVSGRRFDRIELVPLAVQNRRVRFQPQRLSADETARALGRLREQSSHYGAELRMEGDRAVLAL